MDQMAHIPQNGALYGKGRARLVINTQMADDDLTGNEVKGQSACAVDPLSATTAPPTSRL